MAADYDAAIARVPRWILVLGLVGTGVAGRMGGTLWAGSFFAGAIAAWINFRLIEKAVNRLGELATSPDAKPRKAGGLKMFIRFALLVLGAFVIIKASGLNIVVALCGLLVCPAAVMAEIFYELAFDN
jgi:hypothetical protein